jgi:hypothetical protein
VGYLGPGHDIRGLENSLVRCKDGIVAVMEMTGDGG